MLKHLAGLGLKPRDYFQIVNSWLFAIIGGVILVRTWAAGGQVPAYVMGGAFLAYGIYRIRLIRGQLALRSKQR